MILKSISLQNFRSYSKREFLFSKGMTLVVGPNTSGKTNLLEAIYLLSTGRSFRARVEREMINYGQEMARIGAIISHQSETIKLEIILTTGEVVGKKVAKKIYKINGVNRRMTDFLGNLRVVYFGPTDLEIVVDSPAIRRDFLDSVLEQVDRDYRRAHLSYKKGLRQRNRLLEQIRDEGRPRRTLFFWDKLLIENGAIISQKREEFIVFVNQQPGHFGQIFMDYDRSLISPQRLEKYAQAEVAAGMTLVGPHRDNFFLKTEKRDLSLYGSRGEQRTAVFSLKLAQLEFITQKTHERPILLLDDVFSELDHRRRERILAIMPHQQTIMTTADIHLVEKEYLRKIQRIDLGQP